MSKSTKINSLEELRARKAALKAEAQAARQGLSASLAKAPQKVKHFAYEDLALPVMGIGLAAYVGYRLLRSDKSTRQEVVAAAPREVRLVEQPAPRPKPSVPAPSAPRPAPVVVAKDEAATAEAVSSGINFATVVAAGKLLIPAAQAIIGIVQNYQTQQQTEAQLEEAKEEIVEEID